MLFIFGKLLFRRVEMKANVMIGKLDGQRNGENGWMKSIMYTLMKNRSRNQNQNAHDRKREEIDEGGRTGRGEECLPVAHCF